MKKAALILTFIFGFITVYGQNFTGQAKPKSGNGLIANYSIRTNMEATGTKSTLSTEEIMNKVSPFTAVHVNVYADAPLDTYLYKGKLYSKNNPPCPSCEYVTDKMPQIGNTSAIYHLTVELDGQRKTQSFESLFPTASNNPVGTRIELGRTLNENDYRDNWNSRFKVVGLTVEILEDSHTSRLIELALERENKSKQISNTAQTTGSGTQTTGSGTSSSGQGNAQATNTDPTNNNTPGNTNNNVNFGQMIADYNAAEKAKSDALNNASSQTFDQWSQGNFIQGAKPLVDEFARQGSAAGVYGTMGVAAGAQIISAFAEARAARKARKAEEAVRNREFNQGMEAYEAGKYNEAFSSFYNSFREGNNVRLAKLRMGLQLLYGKGVDKNEKVAIEMLEEYVANKKQKDLSTDYSYVTSFVPSVDFIEINYYEDTNSYYAATYMHGKLIEIGLVKNREMDGEWKRYHPNGDLSVVAFYKNNLPEGEFKFYYPGGQLYQIETYMDGLREGEVKIYHPDGRLAQIGVFVNGLKEGELKIYHPNGQLHQTSFFVNGLREGEFKGYHSNGTLEAVGFAKNNLEDGEWKKYHGNGQLHQAQYFVEGKKEGEWKIYYNNGVLQREGRYANDLRQGEWKSYFEDGGLQATIVFRNGKQNGDFVRYLPDGSKEIKGQYEDDKQVGQWLIFYPNGTVQREAYFKDGKWEGERKHYAETGKLVTTEIYKNGKLKKTLKH